MSDNNNHNKNKSQTKKSNAEAAMFEYVKKISANKNLIAKSEASSAVNAKLESYQKDMEEMFNIKNDAETAIYAEKPKDLPINFLRYSQNKRSDIKDKVLFHRIHYLPQVKRFITCTNVGEFMWCSLDSLNFDQGVKTSDCGFKTMEFFNKQQNMVTGDDKGAISYYKLNEQDGVFDPKNKHTLGKQVEKQLQQPGVHDEPINGLSFSHTLNKFATCSEDGTVKIVDFQTVKAENKQENHGHIVNCVGWHPSYSLVASGAKNGTLCLHDPRTSLTFWKQFNHFDSINDLMWQKTGNILFSAGKDSKVKLFDIRTMRELKTLRNHKRNVVKIKTATFDKKNYILTMGQDGIINFYDEECERVQTIEKAHDNSLIDACFAEQEGITLMSTTSQDGSARFWSCPSQEELINKKMNFKRAFETNSANMIVEHNVNLKDNN